MDTSIFELQQWTQEGEALIKRVREVLQNAPIEEMQKLEERVPESMSAHPEAVSVVFAGQYSAGKSTILKVLTRRDDIATGPDIITKQAHRYIWGGLIVVDTPGVHTELRPDHDEIAYEAIADADLLVFVITNELFDSHVAAHFRKLAIDRDKAGEMMLVVNKMQRTTQGNTENQQAIIREDLRSVLEPYSPEDLQVSFIDAQQALESRADDAELGEIQWRKSGFESFVATLKEFAKVRRWTGRYTRPLYILEQILQEALTIAEKTDESVPDLMGVEQLYLRRRRGLLEVQERIELGVRSLVEETRRNIHQEAQKVIERITPGADVEDLNARLHQAQESVTRFASELTGAVEQMVQQNLDRLEERFNEIAESEWGKALALRLSRELQGVKVSAHTMDILKQASGVAKSLGEFLIVKSFAVNSTDFKAVFRLNQYSGTATHEAVKQVGHLLGKSFKPWEAVKWTRSVANAGRVLYAVGTAVNIGIRIKQDRDEAQLEQELREARADLRDGFNKAAREIEMHFEQTTQSYVAKQFAPEIERIDDDLAGLRNLTHTRSELAKTIGTLLDESHTLIEALHANS